jgi:tetratricopeptide (TPR) repeat protein
LLVAAALVLSIVKPALADCKLEKLVELPITMQGLLPTIHAKINGADAVFILDSGAFFSTLSPETATKYGLKPHPELNLRIEGVGGSVDANATVVNEFNLEQLSLKHLQFVVAKGAPPSVAGVLGQNILGIRDVEYDLANGLVRLFQPEGCGNGILAYWAGGDANVLKMNLSRSHVILADALLNGQRISVQFDTGAGASGLSLKAAARAGVKPGDHGVEITADTRGFGEIPRKTWIAPFESLAFDREKTSNTKLRIIDTELPASDMLLGADFFLLHRIYISYNQQKIYFTYNGGPVFRLDNGPPTALNTPPPTAEKLPPIDPVSDQNANTPTDAAGFMRRAAAFEARRDFAHALEDYTHAIALEPNKSQYYGIRGAYYMHTKQNTLAMSDLDKDLALNPNDAYALINRATLFGIAGDLVRAQADLKIAADLSVGNAPVSHRAGQIYSLFRFYPEAIAAYDQALAAKPPSDIVALILNSRCWARAQAKTELDKALNDCNAALKIEPSNPTTLGSRGLVHLQRGDIDAAISDYDAALASRPRWAMSLYGRGVAKLKKGLKTDGDADILAASALNPKIADEAKSIGPLP